MRIGEIWKNKNGIKTLIEFDPLCYEPGDEFVKIDSFVDIPHESVVFIHVKGGSLGVLPRNIFIKSYEKVYDENW